MKKADWEHDVVPREVCFARARRVLDAARERRDRDRALGRLPQQVEFILRRLEHKQRGQASTDHPSEEAVLLHCAGEWAHSDEIITSLRRLEQNTGVGVEDLRAALGHLATAGEIQCYHGQPRTLVSATGLAAHASFVIVADWQRINDNRPRRREA
ncbi:DUF6042 family protein [Streptomyces sp. NPDC007369]|uniref:DUF6042 family protein n=1 Tax=Streptomyces sp. NPDC007369 TaxID=3154589 RepID=UPI0033EB3F7F